jgi:hypothetical protein
MGGDPLYVVEEPLWIAPDRVVPFDIGIRAGDAESFVIREDERRNVLGPIDRVLDRQLLALERRDPEMVGIGLVRPRGLPFAAFDSKSRTRGSRRNPSNRKTTWWRAGETMNTSAGRP